MFNKVILIGRVGSDVELKTAKSGKSFCNINLATNTGYGDNKRTDWHKVVAFGKTAEACAKCLSKGSVITVEGSIQYDVYEKDEKKMYSTSIIAEQVVFLSLSQNGQKPKQAVPEPVVIETDFPAGPLDLEIPF